MHIYVSVHLGGAGLYTAAVGKAHSNLAEFPRRSSQRR